MLIILNVLHLVMVLLLKVEINGEKSYSERKGTDGIVSNWVIVQ